MGVVSSDGSVSGVPFKIADAIGPAAGFPSGTQLLAWSWTDGERRALVIVNYADASASSMIHLPWDDVAGRAWQLDDLLSGDAFARDGDDVAGNGLFVALEAWGSHLFAWTSTSKVG